MGDGPDAKQPLTHTRPILESIRAGPDRLAKSVRHPIGRFGCGSIVRTETSGDGLAVTYPDRRWPWRSSDDMTPFQEPAVKRDAFTLVEILIVVLLISILSGMVTTAVRAAGESAKRSRTQGIIAIIDDVLATKYESYKNRPLPVVVPNYNAATEVSVNIPPREAARVRLIMIRDLMRMEMPDRISDVLDNPIDPITAATRLVIQDPGTGQFSFSNTLVSRRVDWYGGGNLPAAQFGFRNRISPTWTREHESAECLYLIMATTFMDGVPAISSIPASNIGDTDGDGMPEILDGWGNPIGFIRWPAGYVAEDNTIPGGSINDEFDTFRIDWAFVNGTSSVPTAHPMGVGGGVGARPFSLKPLIISGGPDGATGIRFGFGDPTDWTTDIRYSQMTWPASPDWMGVDSGGRPNNYRYIDPYDRYERNRGGSPRAGQALGETLNREQRADNISNYRLQEST